MGLRNALIDAVTNNENVNLVGDLLFVLIYVAIPVLRRAFLYFERLLLARAMRFCLWIRRCSLRSARPIEDSRGSELVCELPKVFLPFRFG